MPWQPVFKGRVFRSQLHARWACAFDALGLEYQLEPWAVASPAVPRTMLDFWIVRLGVGVQVFQEPLDAADHKLCAAFATASCRPVYAFAGVMAAAFRGTSVYDMPPGLVATAFLPAIDFGSGGAEVEVCEDAPYLWCVCRECGRAGVTFEGRSDRLPCKACIGCEAVRAGRGTECMKHGKRLAKGCRRVGSNLDKHRTHDGPELVAAYAEAARVNLHTVWRDDPAAGDDGQPGHQGESSQKRSA